MLELEVNNIVVINQASNRINKEMKINIKKVVNKDLVNKK